MSVIIPVRDDPDGIRMVLDCLSKQTYPQTNFEVVIGDDGSHPDRIPSVSDLEGRIRVVKGPPRTSYAARNMAVSVARGSILAFCDSDCLPEATWLEEGLAALEDAELVAGVVKFRAPADPSPWSLLTIDMFLDQRQNVKLSRGVTANLLLKKQTFDELSGFDPSLPSGGDYDLVARCVARGGRLRYAPLAVVRHPTMDTAGKFLNKIWRTNFWAGARKARAKASLDKLGIMLIIPFVGVVIARHQVFRPAYSLAPERLEEAGIQPGRWKQIAPIALLYGLVCYVAVAGRVAGWIKGWQMARNRQG